MLAVGGHTRAQSQRTHPHILSQTVLRMPCAKLLYKPVHTFPHGFRFAVNRGVFPLAHRSGSCPTYVPGPFGACPRASGPARPTSVRRVRFRRRTTQVSAQPKSANACGGPHVFALFKKLFGDLQRAEVRTFEGNVNLREACFKATLDPPHHSQYPGHTPPCWYPGASCGRSYTESADRAPDPVQPARAARGRPAAGDTEKALKTYGSVCLTCGGAGTSRRGGYWCRGLRCNVLRRGAFPTRPPGTVSGALHMTSPHGCFCTVRRWHASHSTAHVRCTLRCLRGRPRFVWVGQLMWGFVRTVIRWSYNGHAP